MLKHSIVVRTLNEARWIKLCLDAIRRQDAVEFEIILVDSGSSDQTLDIAATRVDKIIEYEGKYFPGRALNLGFQSASCDLVFVLSAHCLPTSSKWAVNMVAALMSDKSTAGCYGRQHPMSFSADVDFRDLFYTFRSESRLQTQDFFFHNANSCIKRINWERNPFCESATNIEDMIWGREVIESGYSLAYSADAEVFHYHGLHHENDASRLRSMVSVLKDLYQPPEDKHVFVESNLTLAVLVFLDSDSYSLSLELSDFKRKLSLRFADLKFFGIGPEDPTTSFSFQKFLDIDPLDSNGFWQHVLKSMNEVGLNDYDGFILVNAKFGVAALDSAVKLVEKFLESGMTSICPVEYIEGTVMPLSQKKANLEYFNGVAQYFRPVLGMGAVVNPRVSLSEQFEPDKFILDDLRVLDD